jgi:hypothetical protein
MGCMSMLAVAFVGLIVLLVCGWFLYVKGVDMFTADAPVEIAVSAVSDQDFVAAEGKLNDLRMSVRSGSATTARFSAAELNALIARDPDFVSRKGRVRVDIPDGRATIEMSVPLEKVPFPRMKGRWFNGTTRLGFSYDEDGFNFDPDYIEANGNHLSGGFVSSFASSFSRSFTTSFEKGIENNGGSSFWRNVKSMRLEGNELVIETRGEGTRV